MINQTNIPIMQKAVHVIYDMSEDTRVKEIARLREKALHDEATALKGAKEEGFAEGKAEGRAERDEELILKMRAMGMTEEQINNFLG